MQNEPEVLFTDLTPRAFDADAPDVQEALFAAPDPVGTMDLFGGAL